MLIPYLITVITVAVISAIATFYLRKNYLEEDLKVAMEISQHLSFENVYSEAQHEKALKDLETALRDSHYDALKKQNDELNSKYKVIVNKLEAQLLDGNAAITKKLQNEFTNKIESLETKYYEELKDLEAEKDASEKELKNLKAENERLKAENLKKINAEENPGKFEDLQAEIKTLQAEKAKNVKDLEVRYEYIVILSGRLQDKEAEINALKTEKATFEAENNALKAENETLKAENQETVKKLEEIKALKAVEEINAEEELQAKINALQAEKSEAVNALQTKDPLTEELMTNLENVVSKIELSLKENVCIKIVEELQVEIKRLQAENVDAVKTIEKYKNALTAYTKLFKIIRVKSMPTKLKGIIDLHRKCVTTKVFGPLKDELKDIFSEYFKNGIDTTVE